jgi:two-component system, sporulation sensor kinase B
VIYLTVIFKFPIYNVDNFYLIRGESMQMGELTDFFHSPMETWLFQILIILFPMLLFQSYFRKKIRSNNQRNWVLGILCGISIILCMSEPVSINNGYILDFRYIPLTLAFLYGGFRIGLILSVMILVYRVFLLGFDGFYFVFIVNSVLTLIFYFTLRHYKNYPYKVKLTYAVGLLTFTIFMFALGTQSLNNFSELSTSLGMWGLFFLLNIITMFSTIYINESLREMEIIHYEVSEFEKLHLISQFSISIAQHVQQPIQSIQGTLENLKNAETITGQMRFEISSSLKELSNANQIIDDYLVLARDDEKEYRLLNIHEEFEYVLKCIQTYALIHQVELNYIPSFEKELYVKGNRSQFQQALLNFMKNGIEAIKQNGKLEVAIHEMLESIYIVIEDNGKGMTKEQLNRLGNPLKSHKENGTGLGTMIAYNIIHSMSGKIDVQSETGKGTTFSIILPKAKKA